MFQGREGPDGAAAPHAVTPAPKPAQPSISDQLGGVAGWTAIHDTLDMANKGTPMFKTMQQADHLAQNADLMGNAAMANRFRSVADANQSPVGRLLEPMSGVFEGPEALHGFGGLSAALGGVQLINGVSELTDPKQRTQGALDTAAGALGLASIANPELAPVAAAAGFISAGNEQTKDWGLWGRTADGQDNKDSVQWAMDNTAGGWNTGRNVMAGTGSHLLTDLGGLVGGGLAGVGSTVIAGAADLGAGVLKTGADAVNGVTQFGGKLITDPGAAAQDAMNFGGQVFQGAQNVVGGALDTAGSIIANPGQALQNAGNTVGTIASGALDVGGQVLGGIGQVGGALVNDAATDAGNLAQGVANVGGGLVQGAANVGSGLVQGAGNVIGSIGGALSSIW